VHPAGAVAAVVTAGAGTRGSAAARLVVRAGTERDAPAVLALFDEAMRWLVARGQTGQWGTEPWSARPSAVARVHAWARSPGLRIGEAPDGAPVGALVLGRRPAWVAAVAEPELYVEALVSSRARAGEDVGAQLVRLAVGEAIRRDAKLLRVDCWAGAPGLVGWYERQGFTATSTFTKDGWRGQVLAMTLPAVVRRRGADHGQPMIHHRR